jgi:hypothetical protein
MITEYDTVNIKAGIIGVAYRTMMMRGLPEQIFKQLPTVNPANKTDEELGNIILNAGNNVEVWQAIQKNFGMINRPSKSTGRISETEAVQKRSTFQRTGWFDKGNRYQTNNYQ